MRVPAELTALVSALDARSEPITLWWRDDDAGQGHPRLFALLDLVRALHAPIALAVVPAWLTPEVASAIRTTAEAHVLQHGFAHTDHAPAGTRKIELGGAVARAVLASRLKAGSAILRAAFGARALPVLVPPWNRIAPDVAQILPDLGFRVLSIWDEGDLGPMPAGLMRLDVHLDPIAWRHGRRWVGLAQLAYGLATRVRRGQKTIGIVTHHLEMDARAFAELALLWSVLRRHPGVRLMGVEELIGAGA